MIFKQSSYSQLTKISDLVIDLDCIYIETKTIRSKDTKIQILDDSTIIVYGEDRRMVKAIFGFILLLKNAPVVKFTLLMVDKNKKEEYIQDVLHWLIDYSYDKGVSQIELEKSAIKEQLWDALILNDFKESNTTFTYTLKT